MTTDAPRSVTKSKRSSGATFSNCAQNPNDVPGTTPDGLLSGFLAYEERWPRPLSLEEESDDEGSDVSYPTEADSYIVQVQTQGVIVVRWIVQHTTQRLNPFNRGPLKVMPPTLGIYSKGFDMELHEGVMRNDTDLVNARLKAGANPNQTCGPLQVSELMWSATVNSIDCMSGLVEHGGNLQSGNSLGHSPIHCALVYGHPEAICVLAELKGDVNQRMIPPWFLKFLGLRNQGGTAIFYAASLWEDVRCVKALLICKANPYAKNDAGVNAFDVASRDSEQGVKIRRILARYDLEYGKSAHQKAKEQPRENPIAIEEEN